MAKQNIAAHRVRECKVGRRALGQDDLLHERRQIAIEFAEIADVPFVSIGERSVRSALPAPVMNGDGETPPTEIGHGLKKFLDEFAPAGEDAYRAARRTARRSPAGEAQRRAVITREFPARCATRHRIFSE
jgi:hypothetical protein